MFHFIQIEYVVQNLLLVVPQGIAKVKQSS